jgi:hypothetical protein
VKEDAMNRSTTLSSSTTLLALGLLLAPTAPLAQDPGPVSNYSEVGLEIDGDYLDDGLVAGEDWFPLFPPFADPTRQDDDTLCATSPAPKNDVTNSYVGNNFEYLFVGMERLANTGNTSFFFSFDVTGNGPSSGDFIFVFCFGSGERVTDTYVLEWDATLGEFVRDSTPPSVDFAVNLDRVLAPFGAQDRHGRPSTTIGPGRFAEARITLAEIEGFDVCAAVDVTLEIQTKSSCSLSSQCKDTTGPMRFSFAPVEASLELSQPPDCSPQVVATANANSPRDPSLLSYQWFLNGEDITARDPSWAGSDSITIDLDAECGENEVRVVVDDGTCTDESSAVIDVNRRPVASIGQAVVSACDGELTYSGAASTDCNAAALSYAWDFDGDGLVDSVAESGTHSYSGCGDRTITLVVSDGDCESEPVSATVHVNEPPAAGVAVSASGAHCLEIAFEVASTDCDELQASDLYAESLTSLTDFGDGSPPVADASGTHRYAACGTYLVTTTTTDSSGCTDTVSREVTVDVVATID